MEEDKLTNEIDYKLREREKAKELTENGFSKYSYETSKERCNRVHRENQTIYANIKEKFREIEKKNLRNRRAEFEINPPMTFQDSSDYKRLQNLKKTTFDSEGFDMKYFNNFYTRRSVPKIKIKLMKIDPRKLRNYVHQTYEPYIDGYKNIGEKATSLQSRAIGPVFKVVRSNKAIDNTTSDSLRNSRLLNLAYEYWKMNKRSSLPFQKQYINTNNSNVSTTTTAEVKSILK